MEGLSKGKDIDRNDLSLLVRNLIGAFNKLERARKAQARGYWDQAVRHWISVVYNALEKKDPDYFEVPVRARMIEELKEKIDILRKIPEDGIDIIVDDLQERIKALLENE